MAPKAWPSAVCLLAAVIAAIRWQVTPLVVGGPELLTFSVHLGSASSSERLGAVCAYMRAEEERGGRRAGPFGSALSSWNWGVTISVMSDSPIRGPRINCPIYCPFSYVSAAGCPFVTLFLHVGLTGVHSFPGNGMLASLVSIPSLEMGSYHWLPDQLR